MAAPSNGKKLVHWEANSPDILNTSDDSLSLSLPNDSTESSFVSTSSLQYVNAQLVAHGFISTPGLSLEGISNEDLNRVTKCLMDLLAQRVKDMARAEQLASNIRTMSYEHERMKSMHQAASESSANFERELNTQRSRLATMARTLQQAENAQKQTMLDLQRTRSALQTVRATQQTELKKKDKEMERMTEKWLKIADSQAKLGSAFSGIRFSSTPANAAILGGGHFGKGKGYLETALEQAEKARDQLSLEKMGLQMTILRVANEVQRVVHEVKRYLPGNSKDVEDPPAFTLETLFPLAPTNFTNDTLTYLSNSLERSLYVLELYYRDSLAVSSSTAKQSQPSVSVEETERLQGIVEKLQGELKESRVQHINVDLIAVHEREREFERLITLKRELEEERRAFTEATLQLSKEKAEIQVERASLDEEKRKLQEEPMLVDLPAIETSSGSSTHSPTRKRRNTEDSPPSKKLKSKPPRRSPLKASFGKGLNGSRSSKRPSLSASYTVLTSPSKKPPKFEPAYETEVIPSSSLVPPSSLLPNSFVLPPPSPKASFPAPQPALLLSTPFEIPAAHDTVQTSSVAETDSKVSAPPRTSIPAGAPIAVPESPGELPRTLPFPRAKPLAPRMIHAYSPARPSPLSRILMLSNSPDSNTSDDLGSLDTVPEEDMFPEIPLEDREAAADLPPESSEEQGPPMTLAQELGVSESPPDSPPGLGLMRSLSPPLQGRRVDSTAVIAGKSTTTRGRVLHASSGPGTKTKGTATGGTKSTVPLKRKPPPTNAGPTTRPGAPVSKDIGVKEKENKGKATTSNTQPSADPPRPKLKPSISGAGMGRGAPRRVPVGSADAPPPVKSRR
ncbi:hypothetical protein E1B28_007780 [Marasmius oreades]|uniref:Afadin and alpha-actinin-binding-domain-containing protein n=1 Tax=Marasmius oreades TaxID=181124 RepID=A0A9P7S2N0_9AGAR|nr:uncharacterized protein E1B28_007780 [Marasmius oreades]KAG7094170.1 hypothetical protein E1B28_007780 [Marasmius oreades]